MKIRASRLPLAMVCPASMQPADYDLNSDSEPARLGTAVHEWLAMRIAKPEQLLGDEAFEHLGVKYSLEVDDIRALALRAWQLWREVQQWFPRPQIEVAMSIDLGVGLVELTGHCDVVSYSEEQRIVFVNDHKTGFLDSDHSEQVKAYGLMALQKFPAAEQVHTCVMKVRDFVTDHANYSRSELMGWADRVVERLVNEGQSYQPGRHCSFCPRRLTCQAFSDWVRWAVELLSGGDFIDFTGSPTPELVRKVYDAKAVLKRLADEAQEVLRTLTAGSGGSLSRDDEYQLQLVSQIRQTVLFRESWPVLSGLVEQDFWNQVFRVSKTELLTLIKLGAGRGEKKQAVVELMAKLEAMGALAETTIERLELRKKTEVITA